MVTTETDPRLSLLPTCLIALGGIDPTLRKRTHLGGREGGREWVSEGGSKGGREGGGEGGGEGGRKGGRDRLKRGEGGRDQGGEREGVEVE